MTGYTIMRISSESYQAFEALRDREGGLMLFATPDEAYQYYRKEHYWDTADIELVEFHDFKLELYKKDKE